MEFFTPIPSTTASSLGMALVTSSNTPLILLDEGLVVKAASLSFCDTFGLDVHHVVGVELGALGSGEWSVPQLQSLLRATVSGHAAIEAYEMDLARPGAETSRLIVNAHRLDYSGSDDARLAVAIVDVTAVRLAERVKDDLLRERQVLLDELQHRVANSLQIIASVLMQSARKVQSDEARSHIHNAHHRVMSIATLQRHLVARSGEVALRPYFSDLCASIGASMIHDQNVVSLTTVVDETVTAGEVSVSLGLIVTELVINALKHAFPDPSRRGKIVVEYRSLPTGWKLTVQDDGVGMPPDRATRKPGLGTGIIDALSRQLDATVSIADANPGTRVSIIHH